MNARGLFFRPRPRPNYWAGIVSKSEAMRLGCTCEWWGKGSIITFDPACPVIDRHHR